MLPSPNFALNSYKRYRAAELVLACFFARNEVYFLAEKFPLATGPTDDTEPLPLEQGADRVFKTATFRGGVHCGPYPIGGIGGIESGWISDGDDNGHSQTV
jgi:hypothetical protein